MARQFCWVAVAVLLTACGGGAGRSAEDVAPTEVGVATASEVPADSPGQGEERRCERVEPDDSDARNAGISARLCVSDATPRTGEEVIFTVAAHDPDAPLFGLTGCRPNSLTFGDEEALCEGEPACGEPEGEPRKVPGRFRDEVRHAYEEAGEYTATLVLHSGSQCPHPYASKASLELDIFVSR